ncbi:MAG TPA: DUF934 domain-containing protein [Burkholderiales bacterium]|nr:DUF934 domain-containing protein [Burkholderiales bacterium]
MALIIKDRNVVTDPWLRLELNPDGSAPAIPATGDVIVPLALWREQRAELLARPGRLGIWLDSHQEPADIAEDLKLFGIVAINFPKFGDGRGFSTASLLRTRYGWKGELRAFGDIFRDQLFYLASVGFDSFVLREGEDPQEALAGFKVFSESYQASVQRPQPLFRRRVSANGARAS